MTTTEHASTVQSAIARMEADVLYDMIATVRDVVRRLRLIAESRQGATHGA